MSYKKVILFITTAMICISCDSVQFSSNATNTPNFVTSTLPSISSPFPTETGIPSGFTSSILPTIQAMEGTTTTQINVRSQTNTASQSLGVVAAFSKVQIIGKESTGNWYKIIYNDTVGWVRAEFVQVDASSEIQVVWIETDSPIGRSGLVISGINVRANAGMQFDSIGVLTPKDVVVVIGKDSSGAWIQIKFAGATGWVAAEFLQIDNANELPVIDEVQNQNTEVAPVVETPMVTPAQTAIADNDTLQSPLFKIMLIESNQLQVTGDVSAPQGDNEDWIEFSSVAGKIVIEISCLGDGLQLELWQAGNLLQEFPNPCDNLVFLNVSNNESYSLRILQALVSENNFTSYLLKINTDD